jgi:uncharacterized hydrophobic protein (TIGR00271 family)
MPKKLAPFLKKLFDLREGAEEKRTIIENIKDDADFSSARLWTLIFAIGVASVGLNINSIPVIIGAMLISPLMGPIVSMGMALAIYDWGLVRRSFRNFLILTLISIIISGIYFALSPISNAQSELLARTQPTIFDVLIAIFGGMAGFIGISRARQSTVIPGVAIATALIPPLCTVGYGLGTLQPQFIFGALYLFIINSLFICLSSLVVSTYLRLPKHDYPDVAKRQRVRHLISVLTVIIVIPAIFLAYTFVKQNNFYQSADKFISSVFEDRGYVIIHRDVRYSPTNKKIELAFLDAQFLPEQITEFEARLNDFGLNGTNLMIRQNGFTLTKEDWDSVIKEMQTDDDKLRVLESRLENERRSFNSPSRLLDEIRVINNRVINLAIGPLNMAVGLDQLNSTALSMAIVYTDPYLSPVTNDEARLIDSWLKTRLQDQDLLTRYIPEPNTITSTSSIAR